MSTNMTLAQKQARRNLACNLEALEKTQSGLRGWIMDQFLNVEWVLARDRTLTALEQDGRWWSGCSLPARAAEVMLAKLQVKGSVACFLAPMHAAHLRTALDRIKPEQAIVAVLPEMRELALMLHCQDFSADIAAHRLWFAAGPAWEAELQRLFERQPGLATPSSFIRTPDCDPALVDSMIAAAQRVFAQINACRSTTMQRMQVSMPCHSGTRIRLCVVAPSQFRLWNDIGWAMLCALEGNSDIELVHFDPDDPASSSPLALIEMACSCDAIFTANTARSDLPNVLPTTMPWITWLTAGRIPQSDSAGQYDHLIAVDSSMRDAAISAGWHPSRVHLGSWPLIRTEKGLSPSQPPGQWLAIISDTKTLNVPEDISEYSSHVLLWQAIHRQLMDDPFQLNDPKLLLSGHMRRLGIDEQIVQHKRFTDELILPAYQQGLARLLIREKIPVKLFGQGWDRLAEFKSHAAGIIRTRQDFHRAISSAKAIVHVWPTAKSHPIDAIDACVVRPAGPGRHFIQQAQAVVANHSLQRSGRTVSSPPLSARLVLQLICSRPPLAQAA